MQRTVGLHHLAQAAIDAKTHAAMPFVGLDMNITGAFSRGLGQQGIEQTDDGCVVRGLQQVLHRGQFLHHALQVDVRGDLAGHQGGTGLTLRIGRTDALHQRLSVHGGDLRRREFAQHLTERGRRRARMQHQRQKTSVVLQQQLVRACKPIRQWKTHASLNETSRPAWQARPAAV